MTFCYSFLQYLDTFRIRQTDKFLLQHALQTFYQSLIEHVVQKLHIIIAVVKRPLYTIFNKVFGQIHIISNIIERNLRFNHPKLGQVTRRIGVLRTECRSKCINSPQSSSSQFTFQLSRYRQTGLFAKEIIIINNRSVFIFLQIIKILGSNLEHLSRTFTIGCCDNRCMKIEETTFMEELMDSDSHVVADAEYSSKCIGAGTQVSDLTKKLHRMTFLL